MAEQQNEKGFVDKTVDFFSDTSDKITEFTVEHELDKKIDKAGEAIERGAVSVFNSFKKAFGKE